MATFCEHLNTYANTYERTAASYKVCLDLMDRILAGEPTNSLFASLERSLNDWELENRHLRELFANLVKKQAILLPTEDGESVPPGRGQMGCKCAVCGEEIPRLEFTEWIFSDDGQVQFRGRDLLAAAAQPV